MTEKKLLVIFFFQEKKYWERELEKFQEKSWTAKTPVTSRYIWQRWWPEMFDFYSFFNIRGGKKSNDLL